MMKKYIFSKLSIYSIYFTLIILYALGWHRRNSLVAKIKNPKNQICNKNNVKKALPLLSLLRLLS